MHRARREQRQLHVVSRGSGIVVIARRIDNRAQLRRLRLKHGSRRRDFDRLAHISYFELKVDLRDLVQLQLDR